MKTTYLGFDTKEVSSWPDALNAAAVFRSDSREAALIKGKCERRIVFAFQLMSDGALVVKSIKPVFKP